MNVLYISPFSHGVNISPELHLAHLVAKSGNNVHFYTVKTPYVLYKDQKLKLKIVNPPDNVKMHYIKNKFLYPNVAYPFINPLNENRDLLKIIRDEHIDILHFNFSEHLTCLPLLKNEISNNLPVVLSINGLPGYGWYYGDKKVDFVGKLYTKYISLKIISKADILIPYSSQVAAELIFLGCDKEKIINMIAHGVNTEFFKPCNDKVKLREKYNLPSSSFIIIYTGRLAKVKQLEVVINSFNELIQIVKDSFLLIVGDGPQKEELRNSANKYCENHIRFINFVNSEILTELYAASDMFILLSRGEGISSALLEACSAGLPMLVSNVGANTDIVQNNVNGFVLDEISNVSVVNGIKEIQKKHSILSENARRIALETLNWNIIANKYVNLYRNLIDRG